MLRCVEASAEIFRFHFYNHLDTLPFLQSWFLLKFIISLCRHWSQNSAKCVHNYILLTYKFVTY